MIRRSLRKEWPALSFLYGIHPWDVERLSYTELDQYQEQAKQFLKVMGAEMR